MYPILVTVSALVVIAAIGSMIAAVRTAPILPAPLSGGTPEDSGRFERIAEVLAQRAALEREMAHLDPDGKDYHRGRSDAYEEAAAAVRLSPRPVPSYDPREAVAH